MLDTACAIFHVYSRSRGNMEKEEMKCAGSDTISVLEEKDKNSIGTCRVNPTILHFFILYFYGNVTLLYTA